MQPLPVRWPTHPATTCGPARMICRKATTTITTARRTPTIISRARRRICHAPTAERLRQRSGVVICAVRWCATHAACTSSFMVSTDRTRCVATQSTLADVVQRAISLTEEVRLRIFSFLMNFFTNPELLQSQRIKKVPNKTLMVVLRQT